MGRHLRAAPTKRPHLGLLVWLCLAAASAAQVWFPSPTLTSTPTYAPLPRGSLSGLWGHFASSAGGPSLAPARLLEALVVDLVGLLGAPVWLAQRVFVGLVAAFAAAACWGLAGVFTDRRGVRLAASVSVLCCPVWLTFFPDPAFLAAVALSAAIPAALWSAARGRPPRASLLWLAAPLGGLVAYHLPLVVALGVWTLVCAGLGLVLFGRSRLRDVVRILTHLGLAALVGNLYWLVPLAVVALSPATPLSALSPLTSVSSPSGLELWRTVLFAAPAASSPATWLGAGWLAGVVVTLLWGSVLAWRRRLVGPAVRRMWVLFVAAVFLAVAASGPAAPFESAVSWLYERLPLSWLAAWPFAMFAPSLWVTYLAMGVVGADRLAARFGPPFRPPWPSRRLAAALVASALAAATVSAFAIPRPAASAPVAGWEGLSDSTAAVLPPGKTLLLPPPPSGSPAPRLIRPAVTPSDGFPPVYAALAADLLDAISSGDPAATVLAARLGVSSVVIPDPDDPDHQMWVDRAAALFTELHRTSSVAVFTPGGPAPGTSPDRNRTLLRVEASPAVVASLPSSAELAARAFAAAPASSAVVSSESFPSLPVQFGLLSAPSSLELPTGSYELSLRTISDHATWVAFPDGTVRSAALLSLPGSSPAPLAHSSLPVSVEMFSAIEVDGRVLDLSAPQVFAAPPLSLVTWMVSDHQPHSPSFGVFSCDAVRPLFTPRPASFELAAEGDCVSVPLVPPLDGPRDGFAVSVTPYDEPFPSGLSACVFSPSTGGCLSDPVPLPPDGVTLHSLFAEDAELRIFASPHVGSEPVEVAWPSYILYDRVYASPLPDLPDAASVSLPGLDSMRLVADPSEAFAPTSPAWFFDSLEGVCAPSGSWVDLASEGEVLAVELASDRPCVAFRLPSPAASLFTVEFEARLLGGPLPRMCVSPVAAASECSEILDVSSSWRHVRLEVAVDDPLAANVVRLAPADSHSGPSRLELRNLRVTPLLSESFAVSASGLGGFQPTYLSAYSPGYSPILVNNLPPAYEGLVVTLTEAFDPLWRAEVSLVDGSTRLLEPIVVDGWRVGFALPPDTAPGSSMVVTYLPERWFHIARAVSLASLLLALAALTGASRRLWRRPTSPSADAAAPAS